MGGFSLWHILILAIILLLLFGGNRFSAMMGDVAKGFKSFKQGMAEEEEDKMREFDQKRRDEERRYDERRDPPRRLPHDESMPRDTIDVTPRRSDPAAPPRDDEAL